jgi:hypothetical protein
MIVNMDIVAKAVKAENIYDKICCALEISTEKDEFLILIKDSFKLPDHVVSDFEYILKHPPVDLEYNFVDRIRKIKEQKDGLLAFIFSMKHFGLQKTEDSMKTIFSIEGMDFKRYKPIVTNLSRLMPEIVMKDNKSLESRELDIPNTPGVDFSKLQLKAERILVPVRTLHNPREVLGVYTTDGKRETLYKLIPKLNETIALNNGAKPLEKWPHGVRNVMRGFVKEAEKTHPVQLVREGVKRRIFIYNS